jgi:hypothetical protein
MTDTKVKLNRISPPISLNDQLSSSSISSIEDTSETNDDFTDGVLSQLKQIIHGSHAGNWHDSPSSQFGGDASLYNLYTNLCVANKFVTTFDYSDVNLGYKLIGTIPANRKITDILFSISTEFDGSATCSLGDDIAQARLMLESDNSLHSLYSSELTPHYSYVSDTIIKLFFSVVTPPTIGGGSVFIYYT